MLRGSPRHGPGPSLNFGAKNCVATAKRDWCWARNAVDVTWVIYPSRALRMFKDIGRETPVFNMFLDVEISVENPFILWTDIQLHFIELRMFIDHRPEVSSQSVEIRMTWLTHSMDVMSYWIVNILSLKVPDWSSLHSLYGHKEWWSVNSGFVLDENNTRNTSVVQIAMQLRRQNIQYYQNVDTDPWCSPGMEI